MKKLLLATCFVLASNAALAQSFPGQLGAGQVWGNSTASGAVAVPNTLSQVLDRFPVLRAVLYWSAVRALGECSLLARADLPW